MIYEEPRNNKGKIAFLFAVIVAIIGILMLKNGKSETDNEAVAPKVETQELTDKDLTINKDDDIKALRQEIAVLRREVSQLKQAIEQQSSNKPNTVEEKTADTTTPIPAPAPTATYAKQKPTNASQNPVTISANDVTLEKYTHDWVSLEASVSLKNNTDRTITQISGRMIYFDMSGNMLDYQDFTKKVSIEPGMVKNINLRGYGFDDHYAYYNSQTCPISSDRIYKVRFELKSYNTV